MVPIVRTWTYSKVHGQLYKAQSYVSLFTGRDCNCVGALTGLMDENL